MKKRKNKLWIFALIFLISLNAVNASIGSKLKGVSSKLKSMLIGENLVKFYDKYQYAVDFAIMFILLSSICYAGLKKIWPDSSQSNSAKGISISIGALLAIASLKAGIGPKYFSTYVTNIYWMLMLLITFLILSFPGLMGNSWGLWRFIVALIITFVAFKAVDVMKEPWVFSTTPEEARLELGGSKLKIQELWSEVEKLQQEADQIVREGGSLHRREEKKNAANRLGAKKVEDSTEQKKAGGG